MSKMFANFATPFFCPKINEKLKLQKLTQFSTKKRYQKKKCCRKNELNLKVRNESL